MITMDAIPKKESSTVRCHRRRNADRAVVQCRRPATYMVASGGIVLPTCSTCAADFPVHWLIGSELIA